MRIFVLGSGSSGNCLVVEAEGERLVVDAGLGPTRATERMRGLGADLVTSRAPLGILVTHDHGDHSAHALPLARALRAPIIAHAGVAIERVRRRVAMRSLIPGRALELGPFVVDAIPVPHDAPQVALRVSAGPHGFALATDLGRANRDLAGFLRASDVVFLESNYCPRLLESGPYSSRLKRRIGGPIGHLANEQAAGIAESLENTRVSRLVLVHLSRTNNTPERAQDVVASRLRRLPLEVLAHGEAKRFDVRRTAAFGEQLALTFSHEVPTLPHPVGGM